MKDPWEKAYVYGINIINIRSGHLGIAHITQSWIPLCGSWVTNLNRTPKPYPVCRNCLRTKRAKELGLK